MNRFLTRSTENKPNIDPTDMLIREMGYSFVSGKLVIKKPDGSIVQIGGEELLSRVSSLEQALLQINKLPNAIDDLFSGNDSDNTINGNILMNDSDADVGDELYVTYVENNSITRNVGVSFSTAYGSMIINRNGSFSFTPNNAARALKIGESVSEFFLCAVEDTSGGRKFSELEVNIIGTNSSPVVSNDTLVSTQGATSQQGNVLSNDSDYESDTLSIVSFTIDGVAGTHSPGTTVIVPDYGNFRLNADGTWIRNRTGSEMSGNIIIRYLVTDGTDSRTGILTIVLQGGLINIDSNPVTTRITGTRTFDVGPDFPYEELDTVPWASMMAGDVVNIHHRALPYKTKFAFAVKATASAPFIINGVTDEDGNRPIIDGRNATTAVGSMPGNDTDIFTTDNQGFGLITIKRRPGTPTSENPEWIIIQNLEIRGAAADASYTNSLGATVQYGFSAGIWIQPTSDVTVRNCVIYDNSQGIFTMSKPGGIGESCQRIKIQYNRIYGNGVNGSGYEHGCYIQGYDALIEGNYLGRGRNGAGGSTYKSRVGKEVIRYNWIESTSRMIDMVHPEFTDAFVEYPDFGIDYVYGNVLINDENLSGNAWRPIHFGSDGSEGGGEWEGSGSAAVNHRKKLYFFSNTYYHNSNYNQADQFFIQLSWPETVCEAWGNVILFDGSIARLNLLYLAGTLNLRGTNLIQGYTTILDASAARGATSSSHAVNRLGTIIASDPVFINKEFHDLSLGAGSPAIDIYSSLPAGIPASVGTDHPVQGQPNPRTNGISLRPTNIGSTDLGALERDPTAPPRVAPVAAQQPALDSLDIYVPGETVSVTDPSWLYNPDTVIRQWQVNTGSGWSDIVGENGPTLLLTASHLGQIRVRYDATNVVGTTVVYSDVRTVTNASAAEIVQIASGSDTWPTPAMTAAVVMSIAPVVGNTLVAFVMNGQSIGDNFGNAWVKRQDISIGYNSAFYQLYTCVVTNTGSNFTVTGTSNVQDTCSVVVYEVAGTYVNSVGDSQGASGVNGEITISATSANQRVIAGFSAGRSWGNEAPTISSPWIVGARLLLSQVDPTHLVAHGVSPDVGNTTLTAVYGGQQYLVKIAVILDPL